MGLALAGVRVEDGGMDLEEVGVMGSVQGTTGIFDHHFIARFANSFTKQWNGIGRDSDETPWPGFCNSSSTPFPPQPSACIPATSMGV